MNGVGVLGGEKERQDLSPSRFVYMGARTWDRSK